VTRRLSFGYSCSKGNEMKLDRDYPPNQALQRIAAPLGSRTVQINLTAIVAARRAFPAAVAELGR
jgi:hypothetical protein